MIGLGYDDSTPGRYHQKYHTEHSCTVSLRLRTSVVAGVPVCPVAETEVPGTNLSTSSLTAGWTGLTSTRSLK